MARPLDTFDLEAARSPQPKERTWKIREVLQRPKSSKLLNRRSRPGLIKVIAAHSAPVEAVIEFLNLDDFHLAFASLATQVTTASTSASVLKPEVLRRTVPSLAVPRASCIKGPQWSPVRQAIPKLS